MCAKQSHSLVRRSVVIYSAAKLMDALVRSRVAWLLQQCRRRLAISCNECSINMLCVRVVSDSQKFDRGLSTLLYGWALLAGPGRTRQSHLGLHLCRHDMQRQAPQYLDDPLTSASEVASRLRLRSSKTDTSVSYPVLRVPGNTDNVPKIPLGLPMKIKLPVSYYTVSQKNASTLKRYSSKL